METRANYALIGLFTLAVIFGAFSFAYYYISAGHQNARKTYIIHFEGSVSGLSNGAAVLFDGLKVGEVSELNLMHDDPNRVYARISVDARTPVKTDTRVALEYGGLTGVAWVAMEGGGVNSPALAENGILEATPSGMQGLIKKATALSVKADEFIDRANKLLEENAPAIKASTASMQTFTAVLADVSPELQKAVASIDPAKVRSILDNADQSMVKVNALLGGSQGKTMVADIAAAARSIKTLAENLTRFTNTGLKQYEGLAVDGRRTLEDVGRAVRMLEKNPQSIIFGNPAPLPEYKGH
jgi:phospholipid/cholesterol/gamma-HCH transport system substrate-binding protein